MHREGEDRARVEVSVQAAIELPGALGSRYRPVRPLGHGGMGSVVLCRDRELDREVAVKLLARAGSQELEGRFRLEAGLHAGLKHRHLVRLLDHGVADGSPYLVLEFLEGTGLDKAGGDPLPPMLQVADALDELHRAGLVHRDVKPSNVMLVPDRGAVLIDLGLAASLGGTGLTRTGEVAGTPAFLAPEALDGQGAVPASDFYSWGVSLYLLLEGRLPFPPGVLPHHAARGVEPEPRFTSVDPAGAVARTLKACLRMDPARRPGSRRDLDALLAPGSGAGKARSAVPAPRSAVGGPGPASRVLPALALAGALALGGMVALGRGRGPGPGPAVPVETVDPAGVLVQWTGLARGVDPAAVVARLHAAVYALPPKGSGTEYQERLWNIREGRADDPEAKRALARRALDLPLRIEFSQDREELERRIADREIPFQTRIELYGALESLGEVDAYFDAWGLEQPYGVERIRTALIPVRQTVQASRAVRDPTVAAAVPAAPGRRLLFKWTEPHDERFPWLVPDPERPNELERLSWTHPWMDTGGKFDVHKHGRIEVRLDMGPDPARNFSKATVWWVMTNLERPNALLLEWNDVTIPVRPGKGIPTRGFFTHSVDPSVGVEVDLPMDGFRPGHNRLSVRTRAVSGLPHVQGVDLNGLGITLGGPARDRDGILMDG